MTSASHQQGDVVKPAWQPRLIFTVLWWGLGFTALYKGLVEHSQDLLWAAGFCGVMWVAFIAWLSAFRLEIVDNVLIYTSPLVRKKSLLVTSIKSATMRRISVGPKFRSSGYQTLVLVPSDAPKREITINARVFPPEKLAAFLDILANRGVAVRRH